MDGADAAAGGQISRRALLGGLTRSLGTTVSLLWLYFVVPVSDRPTGSGIGLLLVGLVALAVLLTRQIRSIARSDTPRLRAIEVLAIVAPLFLLLFSFSYYLMALHDSSQFTQPMSRTDALYFTVTVFATVGFGDIVARSQTARAVVTVQMVLDLALVGVGLRLLVQAVQVGLSRQEQDRP